METQSVWQAVVAAMMKLIPLAFALSAFFPEIPGRAGSTSAWQRTNGVAVLAFGLALFAGLVALMTGSEVLRAASMPGLAGTDPLELNVRLDPLACSMLLLVTFVGIVILRFSRRYLDGDPGFNRYLRWIQATLASVTFLVMTNNLLLLALAWTATSLSLHQLLTHFADRPAALIAAHKKFLASRVAELCVLSAVFLIRRAVGSFEIDDLFAHVDSGAAVGWDLETAAGLLAVAAALKCAQMPFHGWLIQVMEAPTPVSALLHAGVVNIGGFLMIRLAPLMVEAESAQLILVVWGGANAVIAALVMTTRVSIKVALAWSTCAQMGFMLLECGLGAYPLALLHLLAHSLYKAHAFLSAGSVVEQFRIQALLGARQATSLGRWLASLPIAALAALPAALLFGLDPAHDSALIAVGPILVFALVPFVADGLSGGAARFAFAFGSCVAVAALYCVWHVAFGALLDAPAASLDDGGLRIGLAIGAFGVLFVIQAVLAANPHGALARALYPRLFAGLYLDDLFTRLTFRIWPAERALPENSASGRPSLR